MFNYPCVAKGAPCRSEGGHSSFVTAVRFVSEGYAPVMAVSCGGEDASVVLWDLQQGGESSGQVGVRANKSKTLRVDSRRYENKL